MQRCLETVQTLLTTSSAYAVVLEMVAGGDLFDYLIQKAPHGLPECVSSPPRSFPSFITLPPVECSYVMMH